MTIAQKCIIQYLNTQFDDVKMTPIGDSEVTVTDYKGDTMTFTINVFCDIVDASTGEIIAKSDLPHDITKVGYQTPKKWVNNPSYFG